MIILSGHFLLPISMCIRPLNVDGLIWIIGAGSGAFADAETLLTVLHYLSCVSARPPYHQLLELNCQLAISILSLSIAKAPETKQWDPGFLNGTSVVCVLCVSCLTSGTHMAALKPTCPAQFCHLAPRSPTSRSTARPCPTPQRASTSTSPIRTTCTRNPEQSTRADVSRDEFGEDFRSEKSEFSNGRFSLTQTGVSQARSTRRWRSTC